MQQLELSVGCRQPLRNPGKPMALRTREAGF
jgi:hypothetical protein